MTADRSAPTDRLSPRWILLAVITVVALGGLMVVFQLFDVAPTMDPHVTVHGRAVSVAGTTDLPDGAVIDYYFWHSSPAIGGNPPHGGQVTVSAGRFAFETSLADWPPGTVTLYSDFSVGGSTEQPWMVIYRFGWQGERLSGPQVSVDSPGDPKHLVVTTPFELPAAP